MSLILQNMSKHVTIYIYIYIYIYVHVLFSGRGADEVLHVGLPGLLRFLRALPELRARGERW